MFSVDDNDVRMIARECIVAFEFANFFVERITPSFNERNNLIK